MPQLRRCAGSATSASRSPPKSGLPSHCRAASCGLTDDGSCYRAFAFQKACKRLGLRHIRTKPYTPETNGKAERFIQTSLREWAYAQAYKTSKERAAELPRWLHR